ncbi:THO complex subunit 5 homolog A-like [Convolutriloba macropyga]|uniref:THO complex subunit 5 homolog A-like n=1 Tax=Convolutriloba macropyga TaxID=536237 RepID=UPI003F528F5A
MAPKKTRRSDPAAAAAVTTVEESPAKKRAKEEPASASPVQNEADSPEKKMDTSSVETTSEAETCDTQDVEFDENKYVLSRSSEQDTTDAADIAAKLKSVVNDMAKIKAKASFDDNDKTKMISLRSEACVLVTLMRRLNRYGQIKCKLLRENSTAAKEKVDEKYLQLMNVQYEISHLKKEIQKCLNFKSRDEEIELIPVEELKEKADSEIYDEEKIGDDPYLLKLAQLQFELAERKRLGNEFKESVRDRAKLKTLIEQKKRTLHKLLPTVDEVIKSTKPLEEALGVETFFSEVHEKIRHLPAPLFILYSQATAYAEAFGSSSMVSVKILGQPPETESSVDPTVLLGDDDDKDDANGASEQQSDDSRSNRGAASKGVEISPSASASATTSSPGVVANKSSKLLKEHPMMVSVEIGVKDRLEKIEMVFSFLVCLNLVVVKPRLKTSPANSLTTVLTNLFPKDDGADTPNPSNYYMFEKYNITSFSKFTRQIGFAYHWVQRICGVDFKTLRAGDAVKWEESVAAHSLGQVVAMAQERVKSRIELARQVGSLEKKTVPLPPSCLKFYPIKLSTSILKFQPISSEEYRTGLKIDPSLFSEARENAMHFFAVLVKNFQSKEQLHAYIEVMQNYPNSCPVFNLRFSPVATDLLPNWAALLRQLEEEANIRALQVCPDEQKIDLLTVQLYHLMCCFEVMTDSSRASERVYPRQFKGRNRARPFTYKPNTGLFLFN